MLNERNNAPLTVNMKLALNLAIRNGAVFAGRGNGGAGGATHAVSASTIQGLARRGLVDLNVAADNGGLSGVPTKKGCAIASNLGTDRNFDESRR